MQEKRLTKLEAGLEGREKVLAWICANRQSGGFVNIATRRGETNGASPELPDVEDVDSVFLYECWLECNVRVLELQCGRLQKAFFFLCILRFLRTEHVSADELFEVQSFRELLKEFVLQWRLLDRVVEIISEEHFSGMPVLYDDTAAILKKDLETAEVFLAGFNVDIAPRLEIEAITSTELEECLLADAPREVDSVTSLARASAELLFGNRFAGFPLVAKVFRGYESKAKDGFLQVAADYGASLALKAAKLAPSAIAEGARTAASMSRRHSPPFAN